MIAIPSFKPVNITTRCWLMSTFYFLSRNAEDVKSFDFCITVSDGYMSKSPCFGGDPYFCIDIILHFQSLNLPESLGRWSWKGSSVDSCWFPGTTSSLKFLPFERYGSTGFFLAPRNHPHRTPRMLMDPHDEDARRLSKKAGNFHKPIEPTRARCVERLVQKRYCPSCFLFCSLFLLYKEMYMKYR